MGIMMAQFVMDRYQFRIVIDGIDSPGARTGGLSVVAAAKDAVQPLSGQVVVHGNDNIPGGARSPAALCTWDDAGQLQVSTP